MSVLAENLHGAFLQPLQRFLIGTSALDQKPLLVDLAAPRPSRLRLYMYTLVGGAGERSRREYKVVLRVPGQGRQKYQSFENSDERFTLVIGYRADLDVFVFWDSSLHPRFTNGGNLQIRDVTVYTAAAKGRAEQLRSLSNGMTEVVIACQSWNLIQAIDDRIAWTGGTTESEWAISRT